MKNSNIKIFDLCKESEIKDVKARMTKLLDSGRLPITSQNIKIVIQDENVSSKAIINKNSQDAGLTIMGFREETLQHDQNKMFEGYDDLANVLFVNAFKKKSIE